MSHNFSLTVDSKNTMICSVNAPCHCYGEVCLVSNTKKCNEGSVFVDAVPFCGAQNGWELMGDLVCKILGFKGVDTSATSSNGK